jgi:Domain of unknown function (DUF3291)
MRADVFGKKAWTISVWEDEAALNEFVDRVPHSETMKNTAHQLSGAQKFVTWKIQGSSVPLRWEEALRHLD